MKRSFSSISNGATPRGQPPGLPANKSSTGTRGKTAKRQRGTGGKGTQTTLKPFLRVSTPASAQDTPSLLPQAPPGTTGAATALGNLRILSNTPSTDLPSVGLHVASRPASRCYKNQQQTDCLKLQGRDNGIQHKEDQDDGEDDEDGFRIVSSQTYHRPATQHEDTNSSWQDTLADRHTDTLTDDLVEVQGKAAQATQCIKQGAADHRFSFQTQPDQEVVSGAAADEPPNQHVPGLTPVQLAVVGSQQPARPPQPAGSEATAGIPRPAHSGNESVQAQAVTPELAPILVGMPGNGTEATSQHASVDDGIKPQAVAPLFKKASERKLLILVRHGESEYNAAIRTSRSVVDPNIFDARLTQRGIQQCAELRGELLKLVGKHRSEFGEPLWVVSPLTRAIQTFLYSCPYPERLPACPLPTQLLPPVAQPQRADATSSRAAGRGHEPNARPGVQPAGTSAGISNWAAASTSTWSAAHAHSSGSAVAAGSSWHTQAQAQVGSSQFSSISSCSVAITQLAMQHTQQISSAQQAAEQQQPFIPLNVAVLPGIAELMATPGDVGRPPSHLIHEFPQLATQLQQLPEVWWHHTSTAASCALSKRWVGGESSECCTRRVQEFASWLQKRPERLVVLVGHSMYWQKFLGKLAGKQPLKNCGFMTLTW